MADALADEKRQYDATNSDLSLYTISIYKSSLQTVWTAENGLLAHPFNGWMCKKPFYDSAISSGVEQHLTKAESWIISLQGDDNMAQKLAAATAQREERNKALAQAADPLNVNALIGGEVSPIMLVGIGIGAAVVVGFAALFAMRRKKSDVEKKEQKD